MTIKKTLFIVMLALLCFYSMMLAGTTGKIAGKVFDSVTGESVPGANVLIDAIWFDDIEVGMEQTMGAASNVDGEFFIINVNPGTYTLKAMMMGYATKTLKVSVSVDKTTFVEIEMSEEVIQGEEVVVIGEQKKVQKDLTSSQAAVSGDRLEVMTAEAIAQVVETQAGVVGGHFRGGRLGEVSKMIDGVMINNNFSSEREEAVTVETDAVQDLLIISGTFNAEYGKAMSGIVNAVTKEGSETYQGEIVGYAGNYFSGNDDVFIGLDNGDFSRINDFKASLSGPLFTKKISFFVNGRYRKDGGYLWGIKRFNVSDMSDFSAGDSSSWVSEHTGNNKKVSLDESISKSLFAKITFKPFHNMKTNFSYIANRDEFMRYDGYMSTRITDKPYYNDAGYLYKYNPDGAPTFYTNTDMAMISINHVLNQSMFYDLRLNYMSTENKCYVYENPLDTRYVHPNLSQTLSGYYTGGNHKIWRNNQFSQTGLKLDFTWQANMVHGLKAGIEAIENKVEKKEYFIDNISDDPNVFKPGIFGDETFLSEIYTKKPLEISAYLQDKMEFENMIINVGLRYDYFDPKTDYPSDYKNPDNSITTTVKQSVYESAPAQYQLSPRFGLSYQLANTAFLHFSYGHFFQMPPFYALYDEHNFHVSNISYETMMGNGRLDAEKTVSYEVGLQQEIATGMVLDVTVYYRDIYNLLTVVPVETYNAKVYGLYDNLDYAMAKGITFNLDYEMGDLFVNMNYSLQYAEGKASNPFQFFLNAGTQDPVIKLTRLNHDQRHTINSIIGYKKNNLTSSLTLRWNSNGPYTYSPRVDNVQANARIPINNSTMPNRFTADFNLQYGFKLLNGLKAKFFLEIYNLFDNKNENQVWGDSGRAGTTLQTETQKLSYRSNFATIEDFYLRPHFYSAPRMIKMGLAINFHLR